MNRPIRPTELAFDIDGVVADTMSVFIRLARERLGLELTKDHLSCYNLHECLDLDSRVVDDLICLTLDDEHTLQIPPMPRAPEVLTELSRHTPLKFVTARIWPESIIQWLHATLPDVDRDRIRVIATGAPEAKLKILKDLDVRFFVEDRLETCKLLARDGIQPLVFDQPWNRMATADPFPRVTSWSELRHWILPQNRG
ncbi:MAG: 5' nucleotidase, NT5C type [Acidobacteriota bacterium]